MKKNKISFIYFFRRTVLHFDIKKIQAAGNQTPAFFYFSGQALKSLSAKGFPTINKIYYYHNSHKFIFVFHKKQRM